MIRHNTIILIVFSILLIGACGPDTIFLRPGLDTPTQHVKNGHSLLSLGKIDDANAEFMRAKSLNDNYAPAHVGIALVQGYRGDVEGGIKTLNQAKGLAATPEDVAVIDEGYERLVEMQSKIKN